MIAVFAIAAVVAAFTVTWNVTVAVSPALICPAGSPGLLMVAALTNGMAPATSGTVAPFSVVLAATYVVPAGTVSSSVVPAVFAVPVFGTLIVYVSVCPGYVVPLGAAPFVGASRATLVTTGFVARVPFVVGCPTQLTY